MKKKNLKKNLSPKNSGKTVEQGWESSGVSTKPVQIDTLESNAAQNMSDPYCREREKSKRKLIFALAKKRESWVTLLLGQC